MRPSMNFVDKSNAYARGERKVCSNHMLSVWGKKDDGTWFEKCAQGFKHREECKEMKEENE